MGSELVPFGRKSQVPPAGSPAAEEKSGSRTLLFLRAVRVLSADHIRNLAGTKTGADDRGMAGDHDTAPLLKFHLASVMGVGPGRERDELFRAVDLLVGEGEVPRRVRIPRGSTADWTGALREA